MRARRWHTCDRAGEMMAETRMRFVHRTRPDASRSHFQAAATITANRRFLAGCESTSPTFAKPQFGVYLATHTFKQPRLRICRPLHAPCKNSCIRRHRGEFAAPVAQAPGSLKPSRRVLQRYPCKRHRGASTPSPRHRQRPHRSRIPRRHADRRATGPQ